MDSVTSGSKNGSCLPVLRGTLSGQILRGRRGSCNKWPRKWFLSASSSWDSVGAASSLAVVVHWLCTVR